MNANCTTNEGQCGQYSIYFIFVNKCHDKTNLKIVQNFGDKLKSSVAQRESTAIRL